MNYLNLNNIDYTNAFVVPDGETKFDLKRPDNIILSERVMETNSTKPYVSTAAGIVSVLSTHKLLVDLIVAIGVRVTSLTSLQRLLNLPDVDKLVFKLKTASISYKFFNNKITSAMDADLFTSVSASVLGYSVYHVLSDSKKDLYVFITKG